MARVWTEGFEMGDYVGYTLSGVGGVVLDSARKRSGEYSMELRCRSYNGLIFINPITPISECYARFAFYMQADYGIGGLKILSNGTHIVTFQMAGSLQAQAGNGLYVGGTTGYNGTLVASDLTTLTAATWYIIEMHFVMAESGLIEIRKDGNDWLSFIGDTIPGADVTFNQVCPFARDSGQPYYLNFDDMAINDNTGAVDNDWCGDGYVISLTPNGDAAIQLTGSDGNQTDNYLLVDEVPADGDTTYVEGTVTDEEDLYEFGACGLDVDADTIQRVWVEARAKDTVAAGGTCALVTKASGGSEVVSSDLSLLTSYTTKLLSTPELVNPVDSEAWEPADIDALQAGIRTRG